MVIFPVSRSMKRTGPAPTAICLLSGENAKRSQREKYFLAGQFITHENSFVFHIANAPRSLAAASHLPSGEKANGAHLGTNGSSMWSFLVFRSKMQILPRFRSAKAIHFPSGEKVMELSFPSVHR